MHFVITAINGWNFAAHDLAQSVARAIPSTRMSFNRNALPGKRSYTVDFSLFRELASRHRRTTRYIDLSETFEPGSRACHFADCEFRSGHFVRLKRSKRKSANG
jgi:hypothetical protein